MKRRELLDSILANESKSWWIYAAQNCVKNGNFFVIESKENGVYIFRAWLTFPKILKGKFDSGDSALLHWILRDDSEEHLHDHPWDFRTQILSGGYLEHSENNKVCQHFSVGDAIFKYAEHAHRVSDVEENTWTLLSTGERCREWGFHVGNDWQDFRTYLRGKK